MISQGNPTRVHFDNHDDDVQQVASALFEL